MPNNVQASTSMDTYLHSSATARRVRHVIAILGCLLLALTTPAMAHIGSINLFVNAERGLYALENFQIPQLQMFLGTEISVDGPGFVVNFPANGVIPGSEFMVEVTQDLMYWDGQGLAPTTSTFRWNSPQFDNQGATIASPIPSYAVTAQSGMLTGMEWGTYNGSQFWEAHGLNFLEPLTAPAGIYGVTIRLQTQTHGASPPFIVPFVYDPLNQWNTAAEMVGINRLRQASASYTIADVNADGHVNVTDIDLIVAEIAAGGTNLDYDLSADGAVTTKDEQAWRRIAGTAKLPLADSFLPGDANLDGVVDVSDFHVWNAHKFTSVAAWSAGDFNADGIINVADFDIWNAHKFLTAGSPAISAVPEPSLPWGWSLAMVACLGLQRASRTHRGRRTTSRRTLHGVGQVTPGH